MSHNLFDTFSARMRAHHDAHFIVTPEGRNYIYAQALDLSATLASALIHI